MWCGCVWLCACCSLQVAELREYGFVVADLRGIYTVRDMRDQGFGLDELRAGGLPEHAVRAVDGGSVRELRRGGYRAQMLRKVGFPLYETETNKAHIKYLREQEDVIGGITLHNANYNQA